MANEFIVRKGLIPLADSTISGSLNVTGTLTGDGSGLTGVTAVQAPGGTDGQIQYNNAGVTGGASTLYWDDTNNRLGIGTSNPSSILHLQSSSDYDIRFTRVGAEEFRLRHGTSGVYWTGPNTNTLLAGVDQNHDFVIFNNVGSPYAIFDGSTSRVGIGTTSPTNKLEVVGSTQSTSYKISSGAYMLDVDATYLRSYSNGAGWKFTSWDNGYVDRITIKKTGEVGIGTSSPTNTLSVVTTNNGGKWRVGDYGGMYFANNSDTGHEIYLHSRSNGGLSIGRIAQADLTGGNGGYATTAYDHMYIDPTGNVGIGTSNPTATLHVDGASGATATFRGATQSTVNLEANTVDNYLVGLSSGGGTLSLRPGGTERLRVDSTGVKMASSAKLGTTNNNFNYIQLYRGSDASMLFRMGHSTVGRFGFLNSSDTEVFTIDARNERVGIGTTSPSDTLHVLGSTRIQGSNYSFNILNGSDLRGSNHLLLRADNSYLRLQSVNNNIFHQAGNDHLFQDASQNTLVTIKQTGNVGIGTTSPGYKLDVEGNIRTNGYHVLGATGDIRDRNTHNQRFEVSDTYSSIKTGNIHRLYVNSAGNVGIGTDSPGSPLEVYGSGSTVLDIQGSQGQLFSVSDSLTGSLMSVNDISGLPILEVFDNDKVVMGEFGSNTLVVSGSKVGIGTDAPQYGDLDVRGPVYFGDTAQVIGTFYHRNDIQILNGAGNGFNIWAERVNGEVDLNFIRNITASGNVGIGTNTPGHTLHVKGTARIHSSSNGAFGELLLGSINTISGDIGNYNFKNGSSSLMYLKSDGNVGIGTTSPSEKLDVVGNAEISGNLVVGGNFTVNGTTTTINSTTLTVANKKIIVAQGATNAAQADLSGIEVDGVDASMLYTSASDSFEFNKSVITSGDLTVAGRVTAQEFHTEFVSSSIIYESGSTAFGNSADDTHTYTGSLHLDLGGLAGTDTNPFSLQGGGGQVRIDTTNTVHRAYSYNLQINSGVGNAGNSALYAGYNHGGVNPRVGIGTTSPASKLDVRGDIRTTGFYLRDSGQTENHASIYSDGSRGFITVNNGNNWGLIMRGQANDPDIGAYYLGQLNFKGFGNSNGGDNANDRIVATVRFDTQRFGIGTTSPSGKLHVEGDFEVNKAIVINSTKGSGTEHYFRTHGVNGQALAVYTAGTRTLVMESDKVYSDVKVGIGTTSPDRQLQVHESTSGTSTAKFTNSTTGEDGDTGFFVGINGQEQPILYGYNSTDMVIGTNGSERMRITSAGKVAIGSTSAYTVGGTAKLTVAGGGPFSLGPSNSDLMYIRRNAAGKYQWQTYNGGNNGEIHLQPYGGNVGIGTTTPQQKLSVNGGHFAVASGGRVYIGGANGSDSVIGYLGNDSGVMELMTDGTRDFKIGGGTGGTTMFFDTSAGNVGIGTTSPASLLQVEGSANNVATFKSTDNRGSIAIQDDDTTTYVIAEGGRSSFGRNNGLNANNLNIDASGNVGIGTTNPANKLEVYTPAAAENVFSVNNGTQRLQLGVNNSQGSFIFEQHSHALRFGTNNTERMRIASNGNVGIGTSSPQVELHVEGRTRMSYGGNTAFYAGNYVRVFNSQAYQFRNSGGSSIAQINLDGNSYFNGGNVGIGTTSPNPHSWGQRALTVQAAGTNAYSAIETYGTGTGAGAILFGADSVMHSSVQSTNGSHLVFTTNASNSGISQTERMRITSDGNVGIGTTSPARRLDVTAPSNDGIRIASGNAFIGGGASGGDVQLLYWNGSIAYYGRGSLGGTVNQHEFRTNGATRLTIKQTGQVQANEYGSGTFTGTAAYNLQVDSSGNIIETAAAATSAVDGTGVANYITRWVDANTITTSSFYEASTGNIGLGTTTPGSYKLNISGNANVSGEVRSLDGKFQNIKNRVNGHTAMSFNSASDILFYSASAEVARFKSSKLGIGTTTPTAKLQVQSDTADSTVFAVDGVNGRLFSIDDSLDDSLFSVNTIAGLPVIEAFADNTVVMGAYGQNDLVISGSNVGIGTNTPASKLTVSGVSGADPLFRVQSTGTALSEDVFMAFNRDNNNVQGFAVGIDSGDNSFKISEDGDRITDNPRLTIAYGGNVGIGTTSPAVKLDVNGTLRVNNEIQFVSDQMRIYRSGNHMRLRTGSVDRMHIDYGGNVGIGTTSPATLLHVHATGNGNNALTVEDDARKIEIGRDQIQVKDLSNNVTNIYINPNGGNSILNANAGNVGIGTLSTPSRLTVNGDIRVANNGKLYLWNDHNINYIDYSKWQTSASAGMTIENQASAGHIKLVSNGNVGVYVNNNGNVGIGTSTPAAKLDVNGGINVTQNSYINWGGGSRIVGQSSYLRLQTSSQDRISITNTGNVGIGTTSPSEKLDVSGNINVDGHIEFFNSGYITNGGSGGGALDIIANGSVGNGNITISSATSSDALYLNYLNGGNIRFGQGGNSGIWTHDGRLGIGNTSPSAALHVTGDAIITNLYLQNTLTRISSNASGEVGINYNSTATSHYGFAVYDGGTNRVFSIRRANGNTDIAGDLTVGGVITAQEFRTEFVTQTVIFESGSTAFGNSSDDNHDFTGTIKAYNPTDMVGNAESGLLKLRHVASEESGLTYFDPAKPHAGINFEREWGSAGSTLSTLAKIHTYGETGWGGGLVFMTKPDDGISSSDPVKVLDLTPDGEALFTGKVGIGTTSPVYKFEVHGNTSASHRLRVVNAGTGQSSVDLKTSNQETRLIGVNGKPFYVYDQTASSELFTIKSGGNVGIGTSNPYATLTVAGNITQTSNSHLISTRKITARDASGLAIYNDGGAGIDILDNGNVGIGTTSPTRKLDVSGSVRAGGKTIYTKIYGSLDATGHAVAGLVAAGNGGSALFTFVCYGGGGQYQRIVYSCQNAGGVWQTYKVIDEGTNAFDVEVSPNDATVEFTFKTRGGNQNYSPTVNIEHVGYELDTTHL